MIPMTPSSITIRNTTYDHFMGDLIRQFIERRKAFGLTQLDIDYMLGNSDGLCSKWECGSRSPTAFNLFYWMQVLRMKIFLLDSMSS